MATKTFEELKQLAIQIRDEKTNKQNTATRVGTEMLEHLNKLEQDYYDKTTINNRTSEYNVSLNHPTSGLSGSNKYDLSSAIAQVPAELRTDGVTVSFLNADGNTEKWEFSGGSWGTASFSQVGAKEIIGINNNLEILIGENKSINSSYDLSYNNTSDTILEGYSYSEKTGIVYNLTLSSNININTGFPSVGTFHVFGKFRLVTDSEDRKAIMLNSISTNNASVELNNV